MCDTLCVRRSAGTVFGKNSDRPPSEVQLIESHESRPAGGSLGTQYLTIDDAGAAALLGARPAWLWGMEHGVNRHGVAIGNERVFTVDDPDQQPPGLIGMDLVRLGLERATSADHAVELIGALIVATVRAARPIRSPATRTSRRSSSPIPARPGRSNRAAVTGRHTRSRIAVPSPIGSPSPDVRPARPSPQPDSTPRPGCDRTSGPRTPTDVWPPAGPHSPSNPTSTPERWPPRSAITAQPAGVRRAPAHRRCHRRPIRVRTGRAGRSACTSGNCPQPRRR